ncbi:DUF418 domain-containing protein [Streptomyces yangpuensis]|uniref:DUF418 domain-containing protein n=1 Tax=Streptomyces yangpuensis TaxID=1648182 RepID=UPI0007C79353|nr:DUF418 domain-containing protein [Streptomyces yangpuensis]
MGIFLVNAMMMAGPYGLGAITDPGASALDRTVEGVVQTFAVGKFYLMFSFLFGYSFTLQLTSAERAGRSAVPRLLRRSLGLLVLGVLHAVLLYTGDILTTYAVLGLVLIAARNCTPGAALRAARILYGCLSAFLLLLGWGTLLMSDAETAEADAELAEGLPGLVAGYRRDALSVVRANIGQLPDQLLASLLMSGFVMAAFLVGLHCGKRRLLADTGSHRAQMRRICVLGAAVGLPGSLFMALAVSGPLGPRWSLFAEMVGTVTAPALTAAYICGMLLLITTARGARIAALFAPAGRMALTNYLSQSLVMALVFTAYGLALYDRLSPAVVILGALALYAVQLALSSRLMDRHRYGPVEWLLRTITLARFPHDHDRSAVSGQRSHHDVRREQLKADTQFNGHVSTFDAGMVCGSTRPTSEPRPAPLSHCATQPAADLAAVRRDRSATRPADVRQPDRLTGAVGSPGLRCGSPIPLPRTESAYGGVGEHGGGDGTCRNRAP